MTMRTYTYYVCPNGHRGHECLSENDQPYSKNWERTTYEGITAGTDPDGKPATLCAVCRLPMVVTDKPKT